MKKSLDPKDFFEKGWVDTYQKRMKALHLQMSEIRTTFFLYEKIVKFPFRLFGQYAGHFWNLTRRSMFMAIIIGLWRLLYDEDPNSLTAVKLRNEVMERAKNQEAKAQIGKVLREANVTKRLRSIKDQIQRMRHKHFAHLDVRYVDNPPQKPPRGVTLKEVSDLLDAAEDTLNAIGLGVQYMFLPGEYAPEVQHPQGRDPRPDIEKMLDDMVYNCPDFHLPEQKPYKFKFYWKNRSPEERRVYNHYRKKFGLPEIENSWLKRQMQPTTKSGG